jgi:hypothetical protein
MSQNALAIRIASENLRTLGEASISGTYAKIGTALANPSRKLLIQNYTDVIITFSDDGTNDKFVLNSGVQIIFDWTLDKGGDYYAQGTQFWAKGSPTTGSVYLSTWYGQQ